MQACGILTLRTHVVHTDYIESTLNSAQPFLPGRRDRIDRLVSFEHKRR